MSSLQEQGPGPLPTQQEREFVSIHGENQVLNNNNGWVNKIDDLQRLLRFIIIGCESGAYRVNINNDTLEAQNIECLKRLIDSGRGVEAVQSIRDISVGRRNVKQDALLLAFALCARSTDSDTKQAAYAVLSEVCRIPTHLFKVVKFCEEASSQTGSPGTGWGRKHRTAVAKWYTDFSDRTNGAERLARLITKYKKREGWSHKDVVRLAHPSCKGPPELAFILKYIATNLNEAKIEYQQVEFQENENLQRIIQLLEVFDEASRCGNINRMCHLIREHTLSWEHCASDLLEESEVWLALLPHMPITALVRNLGRMTAIGLFAANSEEEEMAVNKLQHLTDMDQREAEEAMEGDIEEQTGRLIHPFTILLSLYTYKRGQGEKGRKTWVPNSRISDALNDAFYRAFQNIERTNKKYFLAVNVSDSMKQPCLGSRSITCSDAAAAMTMMTLRTEEEKNVIVKGFSTELEDLDVHTEDDLDAVISKMERMTVGSTDCAQPMIYAMENKMKDIDVFVVYTDNETWYGNVHPSETIRQYRTYANKPDAKLIVFGMCATEFTIADQEDPNMLDVVGFDSAAPRVMAEFVADRL